MANENVKIRIQEVDKTSPAGAGTDSSDIVFIPGFTTFKDAPIEEPTLCTTVDEFEKKFGKEPYQLLETDIPEGSDYSALGFAAGEYDPSYIYAKELLYQGMSVVYCAFKVESGSALDTFYKKVEDKTSFETILDVISDKSLYYVKYITSGGYPSVLTTGTGANMTFALSMIDTAAARGDAVALVDYQMETTIPLFSEGSIYSRMNSAFKGVENRSFGTAMYPWGIYTCPSTLSEVVTDTEKFKVKMPASFGYLMCVAKAIKSSPSWLAMAGVARGVVPNLVSLITKAQDPLTNRIAEEMQPKFGDEDGAQEISINCITNVRPYGLTLWGNRTLKPVSKDGTVALNFLNTRNMISDIKKVLYTSAKTLMFEQNSDMLWVKFKSKITPFLNQLKSGSGISDYKIIKSTTSYDGNPLQKGELAAVVKIYPLYAVEYFELTVEISDNDVTVA